MYNIIRINLVSRFSATKLFMFPSARTWQFSFCPDSVPHFPVDVFVLADLFKKILFYDVFSVRKKHFAGESEIAFVCYRRG